MIAESNSITDISNSISITIGSISISNINLTVVGGRRAEGDHEITNYIYIYMYIHIYIYIYYLCMYTQT